MSSMRIAAWNSEWATPRSRRGRAIAAHVEELGADLICLTEGKADLLPRDGHVIDSDPDYGYPIKEGRRKVLLWSRTPWREVDRVGDPALPSGRFVSGIADTPIGPIRALGMCIPWSMAHVTSGRRDRSPWEDHLAYLGGLRQILAMSSREPAIVVAGDFNQRIPAQRGRPPARVAESLAQSLATFDIATAGSISGLDGPLIDHIALGPGIRSGRATGWPATLDGVRLSDHAGVVVEARVSL